MTTPPADFDGDIALAVFRPPSSLWFEHDRLTTHWATGGDIPVPGDYDADGVTDSAVFRPANGYWFVQRGAITQFGTEGDIPLPLPGAIRGYAVSSPGWASWC